jgi:hypothetical protein
MAQRQQESHIQGGRLKQRRINSFWLFFCVSRPYGAAAKPEQAVSIWRAPNRPLGDFEKGGTHD